MFYFGILYIFIFQMSASIQDYMNKMQQIDSIAQQTILLQQKRMPQKYSNIQTTLKLLHNLISTFKRRADSYQEQLKARAKISDLVQQISFHNDRVGDCQRLSENISIKIDQRRKLIQKDQTKVRDLRRQIIQLKTDNVKKIIRLQQLQKIEDRLKEKLHQQNRKLTWKLKTQFNRQFYQGLEKQSLQCRQKSILNLEKMQLSEAIFSRLSQKTYLTQLISQSFAFMKRKLCQKQRKASLNGMNGSLMFKMIQNDKLPTIKPLHDKKLMIYDVLKSKHREHVRQEKSLTQISQITEEQFLEYSPIQVMGIIELQGGVQRLKQLMAKYEQEQLAKVLCNSDNPYSNQDP